MSGRKNGIGSRVKFLANDWLAFNATELAWSALLIGVFLFVAVFMG
jgi:hypothetical protein